MSQCSKPSESARVPVATYRLQLNRQFTLRQATELVPYLRELGISHVYASPLLKARPGSTHGYDVCDFQQLNPELGTDADFEALVTALRTQGMGLVLDVVPNHMGIGGQENRWWWDVLEHGPASRYAPYFDIDWNPSGRAWHGKLLLPVLADRYQRVLERGELRVENEEDTFLLRYFDHVFPLAPGSLGVNTPGLEELHAKPEALDAVLQRQHYRLTFWRRGAAELNYRRFFNITEFAGLRIEDEKVFADSHALIRQWHERGMLDGLRVDHLDGLRDPGQYLRRLRRAAPRAWIVVEKILNSAETLPSAWPVAGTTGYEFLYRVGGLFIDPAGEEPLSDFYREFTGQATDYAAIARERKRLVLDELLTPEVNALSARLRMICERHWRYRDFTDQELRAALCELTTCFPVYRTYLRARSRRAGGADAAHVTAAVEAARRQRPDLDPALFDFLGELLGLRLPGRFEGDFVMRFQQLTGPAMAKGVEDTALYCFNRFVALNEVGGNPGEFGFPVEAFHQACGLAQAQWPNAMLATSTHDTKRSEDVRMRLSLLSEVSERWISAVRRWTVMNERYRRQGWPDRNAEYFFYQTLVGAWPLAPSRAVAYMQKAACEAKEHTRWLDRNSEYEQALGNFVSNVMADPEFSLDLERFVSPLLEPAHINSLAQTLVKLTAPGIPDIYQGSESWDLSLVDPDNRRPVDFASRQRWLRELEGLSLEAVWQRREEGLPKLWLIRQTLALRRRQPKLFQAGSGYEPLPASGAKARHVVAFLRGGSVATVVPRLVIGLKGEWADTTLELPSGQWHNELTGESISGGRVRLAELLRRFPVALLATPEPRTLNADH